MLVLSRRRNESIMIGKDVEVTVIDIRGDQVKLGIRAPAQVAIHRKEVFEAIETENRAAAERSRSVDLKAMRDALAPRSSAPARKDEP